MDLVRVQNDVVVAEAGILDVNGNLSSDDGGGGSNSHTEDEESSSNNSTSPAQYRHLTEGIQGLGLTTATQDDDVKNGNQQPITDALVKKSMLLENNSVPRYQELIGNTAMVDLTGLACPKVSGVRVFGKCEFFNPGFSMKDRIVKNIFDKAEAEGKLVRGQSTVVAASSGNTGASVSMISAMRGYKAVITTSPKCSQEKMDAIRAYGAKLLVSPAGVSESHPDSYMNMAKRLSAENTDWFDVNQYDNLDNPEGHFNTLGPEIWYQTNGAVTHFVAGASTGGTISGVGKYLKEKNPKIKTVLADPYGSIFYDYFSSGTYTGPQKFLVEGVGKGSIPGCMDFGVIDDVIRVGDQDAFLTCHRLAREEGLMVGGSAGLNTFAAIQLANRVEEPAVIVTVLCDLGIKYLTKVFNEEWLKANRVPLNLEDDK